MATVALCDLRITFSAFAPLTSLITATSVLCASRSTFSSPSPLLHPHPPGAPRGVHRWLPLHRPCVLRGVHFRHTLLCVALHITCALRGVHRRHPLHAYLCISTPPSYIYAATIYWSTCTWSVSSSPSTGAPCHSRTVAIEIVTAEEF